MTAIKCPKCQQLGAKTSQTYPDIIVHNCDGLTLIEVGLTLSLETNNLPEESLPVGKWDFDPMEYSD